MNCHELWSAEYMDNTFSKYWRTGDYKDHRSTVLLDRERAQFPATIGAVEEEKRRRDLRKELVVVKTKMRELQLEENRILTELGRPARGTSTDKENIPKILCKCPGSPSTNCQGFVLTSTGKCAACDTEVCATCLVRKIKVKTKTISGDAGAGTSTGTGTEEQEQEHTCKAEDIATAKLIRKECKPCPGCAVHIHRWTGCPMMFCTNCNTAFDWRTLEKITHGRIHNAHYTEYLARQGPSAQATQPVQAAEVNCDVLPNLYELNERLNRGTRNKETHMFEPTYTQAERTLIARKYQVIAHIQDEEMPKYNVGHRVPVDNQALRVSFMMNDMNEETFKTEIIERDQKRVKMRATYEVLEMYVRVGTDLIRRMMTISAKDKTKILGICDEITELNKYTQDCFEKQKKRFGSLRKPNMEKLFGMP